MNDLIIFFNDLKLAFIDTEIYVFWNYIFQKYSFETIILTIIAINVSFRVFVLFFEVLFSLYGLIFNIFNYFYCKFTNKIYIPIEYYELTDWFAYQYYKDHYVTNQLMLGRKLPKKLKKEYTNQNVCNFNGDF